MINAGDVTLRHKIYLKKVIIVYVNAHYVHTEFGVTFLTLYEFFENSFKAKEGKYSNYNCLHGGGEKKKKHTVNTAS